MIRAYIRNQEVADKQLDQLQLKLAGAAKRASGAASALAGAAMWDASPRIVRAGQCPHLAEEDIRARSQRVCF
jgi:hypothetical protein